MYQNIFLSPFVIPVAGMALALGIILIGSISNYYKQKLISEERLTALAKGLPLPPPEHFDPPKHRNPRARLQNTRQGAIVTIAVGIGLVLFSGILYWVTQERGVLVVGGAGLIPLCIGIGMFVDYVLQLRDFNDTPAEPS